MGTEIMGELFFFISNVFGALKLFFQRAYIANTEKYNNGKIPTLLN